MTNLLLKTFIKDYKNTSNPTVREKVGQMSGIVGIVLNTLLAVAKILVGALFGLVSVLADGLNNLTDCGSNVVSLISFKLSGKPADKEHPFGHQRIEYVASLAVGVIVLLLAFELGSEGVNKIVDLFNGNTTPAPFQIWTVVALGVSVLVKLWMFLFNRKLGKTYNSELLLATSTDSVLDATATTAVLVSVLISLFTGFDTDGIMSLLVAILIAVAGIKILKETLNHLLGEAPTAELIKQIEQRVFSFDGVKGIHDLNVHNYGPNKYYASVHVEVDSSVPVLDSHDMIDQIERDFAQNTPIVMVVHLDPIVVGDPELDTYKAEVQQIVLQLDEHFTIHDFRMVKGPTHTNLIFDVAIHFDTTLTDQQIKDYIQTQVTALHPNVYVVPTVEKQIA